MVVERRKERWVGGVVWWIHTRHTRHGHRYTPYTWHVRPYLPTRPMQGGAVLVVAGVEGAAGLEEEGDDAGVA